MKILHVFPMKDAQTGLSILRAFKQLGHTVEVVDAKIEPERTVRACEKFNPDLIFCGRTPALFKPMKIIKKKYPKVKIVCLNTDKRKTIVKHYVKDILDLFKTVHILYTIAKGDIEGYKKICPNTIIKHLQQGCDIISYHKEILTIDDHKKYDCDLMFAGSLTSTNIHHNRTTLMNFLSSQKDINFKIFGNKGNRIYDSEHSKACACAKICLGHNGVANIAISMSVRVYKVMAAGGFLLEEYCPGIETWFNIGQECDVYKSDKECIDKVRYYLSHSEERVRITENGYNAVREKHKYIDRMRVLINDVINLKV